MDTNVSSKTKWLLFALAIPIMIWTIVPLLWTVALSGKKVADLADPNASMFGNFWPKDWTWENYDLIFNGGARDLFMPAFCGTHWWSA